MQEHKRAATLIPAYTSKDPTKNQNHCLVETAVGVVSIMQSTRIIEFFIDNSNAR